MDRITLCAVAVICAALFASPAVMASAGKALLVTGTVKLEGKRTRELKAGDSLDAGDVVATGEDSRVQLLMADGARIALRASSKVRIDELTLPSNVQQPGLDFATAGRNVGTLLQGGFSTRDGDIDAGNASFYEMRTPMGTLAGRGAHYTAVLCQGDCDDGPGSSSGESIQDGLYVAVDKGTVTFKGGGITLTLTAPRVQFIPLERGETRRLSDLPSFLLKDGAGVVRVAGRSVQADVPNTLDSQQSNLRGPNGLTGTANGESLLVGEPGEHVPERSIAARSVLGRNVDLIVPEPSVDPRANAAVSVATTGHPPFVASSTELSDTLAFNIGGSLLQFNAPYGASATSDATYLSGAAALVDFGSNGASGIRWGRWTNGTASISTSTGIDLVDLQNASVHWVVGPEFETAPVLPVSGMTHFVLAGGTSPTDNAGHIGVLSAATLTADFTSQQVTTALSLDVNGYNWFAAGGGSIADGTTRFSGTFSNVLVDGRVGGTGEFNGFLSAGALTTDQLNGAGLSYWLTDHQGHLGTVSGALAFVPGPSQPLAPPVVQRDVAYAVGNIDHTRGAGGVASNSLSQLAVDANGHIRAFTAPVPHAMAGTLAIGMASVTNTGADAATGIRWGRWHGGAIDLTTPPTPAVSSDMSDQSLHWIVGNEFGATPILPQTGTATYTLVGNTNPTDTLGNIGTLGVASFNADFTNRSIHTDMTLNVAGLEWYASGSAAFPIGGHQFNGSYDDVRVQNLVRGQGSIHGFFTLPRIGSSTGAGAGLSYSLADNAGQLGVISGVLAFADGGPGGSVTPAVYQDRDIAMNSPDVASGGPFTKRATPAEYALDANFGLTGLPGLTSSDPARYVISSSVIAESDVAPLVMLRWGRWSGGEASVANLASSTSFLINLDQQSLHWIEGPDSAAPPVMPQFGTAHYALIGATSPTDRAGNVGVMNNASLAADFTNQLVSASFDITINDINVVASGDGSIGAAAGLAAHQFNGAINAGVIGSSPGTPQGSFSGFFSAPGGTVPGIPGGAGLTYSISDNQSPLVIDGAAAFRGP